MLDLNEESPEIHSLVRPPAAAAAIPQFATAEYTHVAGTERCHICGNLIPGDYYRVAGQMSCATCATAIGAGRPTDSHAAFVRGLMVGIGAALAGLTAYAAFTIVTHLYIGYLALGVGWLVAKGMMKGSGGVGGRRYQVTAVLLTYAAISMAAVPIGISYAIQHRQASASHQSKAVPEGDGSSENTAPAKPAAKVQLGPFLLKLVFVGLASPFLELSSPAHGAIGLFILFIGLRIAWQMTGLKPLPVDGPYPVTA